MARHAEGNGEAVDQDVDEMMREAFRACANYKAQIKVLNDQFKEYRMRVIKGELGLKLKNFQFLQGLYEAEPDEQNETLRTLKIGFRALEIGGQLDWIDEVERKTQLDDKAAARSPPVSIPPPPVPGYMAEIGREARRQGKPREGNPNLDGSQASEVWDQGWLEVDALDRDHAAASGEEQSESPVVVKRGRGRPKGSGRKVEALFQ